MLSLLRRLFRISGLSHFRENRFRSELVRTLQHETLSQDALRAIFFSRMLSIAPSDGIIVECGVGAGGSLIILSKLSPKHIYAFDSFEGFPDSGAKDSPDFNAKDKFVYKHTTESFIYERLRINGIPEIVIKERISLVKGFFEQSLPSFAFKHKISFLHLDVDLYESYKTCLEYLEPHLLPGAIIIFDEYDSDSDLHKWPGAKIAIDEFATKRSLSILKSEFGKAYAIYR